MNFISARVVASNDGLALALADGALLPLPAARSQRLADRRDQEILLGVRPEHMSRAGAGSQRPGVITKNVTIELVQPTGSRTYATFRLGGAEVVAELQAHDVSQPGESIDLAIDMNRIVVIDPTSERVLL